MTDNSKNDFNAAFGNTVLSAVHLAPYLPYGLKMVHFDSQFKNGFEVHTLNGLSENYRYREEDLDDDDDKELLTIKEITFWFNHSGLNSTAHNVKPILRPLSDLFNGNYEDILDEFSEISLESFKLAFLSELKPLNAFDKINYTIAVKLFENHFDVFGLLKKGLAIDINTLSVE